MDNIDNMNNINTDNNNDVFWLDDITILFKDCNYIKFLPTKDMTRIEQLNSLTLFCIYLLIIFIIFDTDKQLLLLPICGMVFIVFLYYTYENDDDGKNQ